MTTADAQLSRLLELMPRLADGREHSIASLAKQLHVPPATVTQDLQSFTNRFGDPPGWVEKVNVFVESERVSMLAPSHFQRPMRLAPDEARALKLGLSILRVEAARQRSKGIEEVLGKIRSLEVPPEKSKGGPRGGLDGGATSDTYAASTGTRRQLAHVPLLREALKKRRRVAVNYRKSGADTAERRTICPFTFAVEQGAWYLVAQCDTSDGIRIFRLDRIESIELLNDTFEPPVDLDVDRLLTQHHAFIGAPPRRLRVRYSKRVAKWIAERERGTTNRDGSFEVEYPLGDEEWAVRHVLQYGPEAQVLSPVEVREAVVERLRSALVGV